MKKTAVMILCAVLLFSMAGCSVGKIGTDSADGQISAEKLEMLGISAEEFADMDPDAQQALLDELGAVAEDNQQKNTGKSTAACTPADVMAGGSYEVVLGDYMNSITLYYENGVLVKLVERFQKSYDEEVETATYEGDALAAYGFNFIDWSGSTLQDILDGMSDYGGFGQYTIRKVG